MVTKLCRCLSACAELMNPTKAAGGDLVGWIKRLLISSVDRLTEALGFDAAPANRSFFYWSRITSAALRRNRREAFDMNRVSPLARLGYLKIGLHPQHCIHLDPKRLFKPDRHLRRQSALAVHQSR